MVARSDKIDTREQAGKNAQPLVVDTITSPEQLFSALQLPAAQLPTAEAAARLFPLKFPRRLLDKIPVGQPDHPLLRQFLPQTAELTNHADYSPDPLAEAEAQVAPGLLHKYHGRVLLITTAACAVHCRYCFRRHYPYREQSGGQEHWQSALNYIREHTEIHEVILSGGDPLSLSDRRLAALVSQLASIAHVQTLRLHSRTAALFPERITDSLIDLLASNRLNVVMVLHINHADELAESSLVALAKLTSSGVLLLNLSVLLAGVNDDFDTLTALSRALIRHQVLPYYLHLPDRVAGTAHFMVTQQKGKLLVAQMQRLLPGYQVPKLVIEIAHQPGKTVVA